MNHADQEAKLEPTERSSAGAGVGSIDKLDEQLRVSVDALLHLSPPPTPELDDLLSAISHHLDNEASERKAIRHRLLAIENEMERVASGGFVRYLVATCIVVAAILAWQSYGDAAKQMVATRVPELGWSPQTKQVIAGWMQQLGWSKPLVAESKVASVNHTAVEAVASKAPAATSVDPVQVQQMVQSLSALRESVQQLASRQQSLAVLGQTVDRLATGQDQMVHQIDMLQSANQEILEKIPAPPPQPPAATARKPAPVHPARKLAPTPFWAR
ncbi:MAG: hypothetical protein WA728_14160 [Xanthobacteraceae bacterium]